MYAIQNIKTGKFVYGTDYRYGRIGQKHNQRTSKNQMLTYDDYYLAAEEKPKTGRWIFDETLYAHYYCSECKSMGFDFWDYCPNCGAKMAEGE